MPVLRVDVARSLFVHKNSGGYFRRIGSSKREMAPDALARLFQERSQSRTIRFDESVVPASGRSDLHYSLTRRFLAGDVVDDSATPAEEAFLGASEDDLLRKLRVVADDVDGEARLTLAGVLLCTEEPQRWLPHAYIQAVSYADYQTDARDIGGPLDQQVAESLHFVRRNMLVGDRLELYVPGALANTLTPDSLHLRQANRNELIVSLLARCPTPSGVGRARLMDRRGDGVPIIRRECEELSGHLPEYRLLDDSELLLVMRAAE